MKADWRESSLADVSQLINRGISPKYVETGGVPVINQKCIRDHEVNFALCRRHDIAMKSVSTDRFVQTGDVLVNSTGTGTLGRVAQIRNELPEPTTVDSHVTIVRPMEGRFFPPFFGYAMTSIESAIQSGGEGCGGQTELARSKLANGYRIRFPVDHAEQKRIVAFLDQAFEAIETAKWNADANLRSAKELFETYLTELLLRRSKAWRDEALSKICVVERGSSPRPIKKYFTTTQEGVNWIKIGDTEEGGKYVSSTSQKITTEGAQQSRYVRSGDLILTNSMSYGRPYIMATDGYIHDGLFVVRPNDDIDTEYFYYLLSSHQVQAQFSRLASGSVVQNISGDLVKQAILPIPPVSEQRQIVGKIRRMETEEEHLGSIYAKKQSHLGALRGAILDYTFGGRL
jgi:type I restriction enzyme S subunit